MWVWDERSAQTIGVLTPKDRLRFYSLSRCTQAAATLADVPGVWREYQGLLSTCYAHKISLRGRIGVAISPKPGAEDRELAGLGKLGKVPALIRFYCHDSEDMWQFAAKVVRSLHAHGHSASIALVQDRSAVLKTERWRSFVARALDLVSGHVEWVEVGHAINRVKWGAWDFDEYSRLASVVAEIGSLHPGMKFMGPAGIDFEYVFVKTVLRRLPSSVHFNALSHHLYVDRRGAPENRQGPFSALEKFALARAIARHSKACEDRLIVSEVNWPLKGVGVYSPVASPYETPGPRLNDPSVSEDRYADYMIRYIVIAICSGMVDRVYWWRLVARGFGLIDDSDAGRWRERPAYQMLRCFISILGESTFLEKSGGDGRRMPEGVHFFMFERPGGDKVCLAYSATGEVEVETPFEYEGILDAMGNRLEGTGRTVFLSGRPVYMFLKR